MNNLNKTNEKRSYSLTVLFSFSVICFLFIQELNAQNVIPQNDSIVYDIDGNLYHTIKIGNQIWMKENLKVTRYRNGDTIFNVGDNNLWVKLKTGALCNYDNNENYKEIYGLLYNWYALGDTRNIAPEGWHVPSNEEITALADYLGGYQIAGSKMKEADTIHWQSPNTGADNSSGYSALPGGTRYGTDGSFGGIASYALFWTTSSNSPDFSFKYSLDYDKSELIHNYYYKFVGYSVRCIKD